MQISYTIRVDEELLKKVQQMANKDRRSVNQTFNIILEEYFEQKEKES